MQHCDLNEEAYPQQVPNKRQRRHQQREDEPSTNSCRAKVPLFLPTHLSLLRALHADDETAAGADMADSFCPRPSWVEVSNFLELQHSMMKLDLQISRVKALTLLLQPPSTTAAGPHNIQSLHHQQEQEGRRERASRIEEARPLDPRSVVSAVLRRAGKEREDGHGSRAAGLRILRNSVDDTVDHLSTSLGELARSRKDRARPWRIDHGENDGQEVHHAADVLERHANKLLLWRRLQAALSASRVGVNSAR
ncbi:unnamed protein product [Scytosiphon promiscuus]